MKQLSRYLLLFMVNLLLFSCQPAIDIFTDQDPDFALENYRTFGFVEDDIDASRNLRRAYSEEINIIRQTIIEQLQERGLEYTETNPDLNINIGIVVDERLQTRETNIVTDPPTYIGQRRYRWETRDVVVGRYQLGTVTLHLIDTEPNELVWLGVAEGVIPRGRERIERQIRNGISDLIQSIPE